jgi:hypothetical protein
VLVCARACACSRRLLIRHRDKLWQGEGGIGANKELTYTVDLLHLPTPRGIYSTKSSHGGQYTSPNVLPQKSFGPAEVFPAEGFPRRNGRDDDCRDGGGMVSRDGGGMVSRDGAGIVSRYDSEQGSHGRGSLMRSVAMSSGSEADLEFDYWLQQACGDPLGISDRERQRRRGSWWRKGRRKRQ